MRKNLAIAVFTPVASKERECLEVTRALCDLLSSKGYAHDALYRDSRDPSVYLDIREWRSTEAAIKAHQDLEVHACWERLDKVCTILKIYERLEEV